MSVSIIPKALRFCLPMIILILLLTFSLTLHAADTYQNVDVFIDDVFYENESYLIDNTTYVYYADFINAMTDENKIPEFDIIADSESNYIIANGRYLYSNSPLLVIEDKIFAPIRLLAKIFQSSVEWIDSTRSVQIRKSGKLIESGDKFYDYDDVYWLSRIIYAESGTETLEGKLAVGAVVLNRVDSEDFPNDIYGVIFDTEHGVQFSPVQSKTIYNTPDDESVIAAKICLDGYRITDDIIYFLDESAATSKWIVNNRTYIMTIGCHDFYS